MDWLDNEIDKWWCSQYTEYKMKRVPGHKFVPEPAFADESFNQTENGEIGYELWMDWQVDSSDFDWDSETIRKFAKYFYNLGLKTKGGEE